MPRQKMQKGTKTNYPRPDYRREQDAAEAAAEQVQDLDDEAAGEQPPV